MKKLLSLFLTASLLAACGGYKAPEEETNSEEPQTETEPETTAEAEPETQEEDNAAVTASSEYDSVGEFPASGFTVVLPGDFVLNMSGELSELKDGGELEYGMGIITANWDYRCARKKSGTGFTSGCRKTMTTTSVKRTTRRWKISMPRSCLLFR